jgi:hypothetical protein
MPTKSLPQAKAGVGIHDYGAACMEGVDGGPSPTMTGYHDGMGWSVPRLTPLLLGVALARCAELDDAAFNIAA